MDILTRGYQFSNLWAMSKRGSAFSKYLDNGYENIKITKVNV